MKIHKNDTVLIISGKDRTKKGKVLKTFPKEGKILVEGANLKKRHQKPKKSGQKGQIIELPGLIDISSAKLICPKCGKAVRVGYRIISNINPDANPDGTVGTGGSGLRPKRRRKNRICKKCDQEI
jgi:large subunit ribosomal protein L24